MRNPVFVACAAIIVLSSTVCGAPLTANSTLSAVTVYTDRAVVTRTASLELNSTGSAEVVFEKLPANLLDQSLQVSGRGSAQVTILDVAARSVFVDFTPNDRVKALEDELRALAKQRRVLDDRSSLLKAQETTLGRLETAATTPPTKDSAPRLTIEDSGKLLGFLEEQRAKITLENQALATQVEDLTAKTEAVQRQLNQLRGSGGRSYKSVNVRIDTSAAGALTLSLSYAVPGASWSPSYDARVNSNEKSIALSYLGIVRQNTGEDWKDIALTLSTARPGLGGAAPEQRPWVVDVFQPRPMPMSAVQSIGSMNDLRVERSRPNAPAVRGGAMKAEAADALQLADAQIAQATVDTTATSASFKVATPASIPSDNSPQKIPITTAVLAALPEYLTTPKLQAAAFLTAKATNSSEYPLLAGTMSVFLDGTFVATSSLRTVMPGEKFDLALGVDEGISVKHKRVQRFTEDTGLTNSGKRITYEYLLTIQNNKKIAARVVVTDQLPVSRHEKIVVKQLAPDAKEIKPTSEGTLKWTLELKPAEKRDLALKFSIDHPNEVQVTGLEP